MGVREDLRVLGNKRRAKALSGFFKTGKGDYGEGDVFLGISVPAQRSVAKRYADLPLSEIKKLLRGKIHEFRLTALLVLVQQYQRADASGKKKIVDFYLANATRVNNWDLVDLTADKILGAYLADKPKRVLYRLARSSNLWERRMSIVATFDLICRGDYEHTLKITKLLMKDDHDLIHKACGWMLREVGKRNVRVLERFLDAHAARMPRTMLRYSIERLPDKKRARYLSLRVPAVPQI